MRRVNVRQDDEAVLDGVRKPANKLLPVGKDRDELRVPSGDLILVGRGRRGPPFADIPMFSRFHSILLSHAAVQAAC